MINLAKRINYSFIVKRLVFGNDCNQIIAETASEIAKVVSITLGPYGRNVLIENHKREPRITKDGITVVKHIEYVVYQTFSKID